MKKMCLYCGKIKFYPDVFTLDRSFVLEEEKKHCSYCQRKTSHLYFEKESAVFSKKYVRGPHAR